MTARTPSPSSSPTPIVYAGTQQGAAYTEFVKAFNEKDYDEAESIIEAGRLAGTLTPYLQENLAGVVAVGRGDYDRAMGHFLHAREAAPDPRSVAAALENIAETSLRRGEFFDAVSYAHEALVIEPTAPGIWPVLISALQQLERYASVSRVLERLPNILNFKDRATRLMILENEMLGEFRDHPVFQSILLPLLLDRQNGRA